MRGAGFIELLAPAGQTLLWRGGTLRVNADGSLDTTFGGTATGTLGGTVTYSENGSPVVLDSDVRIFDFELSSNNGGWQWASGSGCDAAPYFRVFNPQLQLERFDPELKYVKHWVPEYGSANYVQPMVVHQAARERAISVYKQALSDAGGTNPIQQTQLFA